MLTAAMVLDSIITIFALVVMFDLITGNGRIVVESRHFKYDWSVERLRHRSKRLVEKIKQRSV